MKKRNKKIVVGCVVGALLIGGCASLGIATKGFVNWNVNDWKQNINDIFNNDGTKEPVESLNADLTNEASTYYLPKNLNFGYNQANSVFTDSNSNANLKTFSDFGVRTNGVGLRAITGQLDKIVNVTAFLNPVGASYSTITWSVNWANANSTWATGKTVDDYVTVAQGEGLNASVNCKRAFSEPIILKVRITKNEIAVEDNCVLNFYKKLTGINVNFTGDMIDKILELGQNFTYDYQETYGDGTLDLTDTSQIVETFSTLGSLAQYVDYCGSLSKYKLIDFTYDSFYSDRYDFIFTDTTLWVNSGKGRNKMNSYLNADIDNFNFKISKGNVISNSLPCRVKGEAIIYPESVVIGDGSDLTING